MGSTSNYSWPTPEQTDLVKDGWDAIKDLGDAADTTVKAVADGRGLVHINTTSFSAVASQSINDVFSSTYDNYKIIARSACSTTLTWNFRMRVGGSDHTGAQYTRQRITATDTSLSGARQTGQTVYNICGISTGEESTAIMDLFNPFQTTEKGIQAHIASNFTGAAIVELHSGAVDITTSFTGFSLLASTGNITGTVSVYGYRK